MRVHHISFLSCLVLLSNAGESYSQDKRISLSRLPDKSREFLQRHYARMNVFSVTEDVQSWFESTVYRVVFKGGERIKFDESGNWSEIDARREAVPLSIVPTNIITYLQRSFPRMAVTKIERNKQRYIVAISSGIELEFNNKGEFLKINQQ